MQKLPVIPREETWEVLSESENGSTVDLLKAGLSHEHAEIHEQCFTLLMRKADPASLRVILSHWPKLNDEEQQFFKQSGTKLLDTCRLALSQGTVDEQRQALEIVEQFEIASLATELIALTADKRSPVNALAARILLHLCEMWGQRARRGQDDPGIRNPIVNALYQAFEKYAKQDTVDLVNAWLLIITWEDPLQRLLVNNPLHVAFRIMLERLRNSKHPGVIELLAGYLWRGGAPSSIFSVIVERPEREFAVEIARQLNERSEATLLGQLRELAQLNCLRSFCSEGPNVKEEGQNKIWTIIAANSNDPDLVVPAAITFAKSASFEGRRSATAILKYCPPLNVEQVVSQLYRLKENPNSQSPMGQALNAILSWLNSPSVLLRESALTFYSALKLEGLYECIREWPVEHCRCFANVLAKVSPTSVTNMIEDLENPSARRRLVAIQALHLIDNVPDIRAKLLEALAEPHIQFRVYVIDLLAKLGANELVPLLPGLLAEPSTDIQEAATRAMKHFRQLQDTPVLTSA